MRVFKTIAFFFVFWTQVGVALCSQASTYSTTTDSIAYSIYDDKTGQLPIEEITKQTFSPSSSNPNLGFSTSALWVKFNINQPFAEKLFLNVWPARLEGLEFYRVHATKDDKNLADKIERLPLITTRENASFLSKHSKINLFELGDINTQDDYYLRVRSNFALQARLEIATSEQKANGQLNQEFILGGIVLALTPLAIILLGLTVHYKSNAFTAYFFTLISTLILYLTIQGFDLVNLLFNLDISKDSQMTHLVILNSLSALLFISYGVENLEVSNNILLILRKLLVITYIPLFCFSFFNTTLSLQILAYVTIFIASAFVIFTLKNLDYKNKTFVFFGSIFLVMNILGILATLNLMGHPVFKNVNSQAYQLSRLILIPFIFGSILWIVERQNRKKIIIAQAEKQIQEKINADEIERRQLYENFITMLVHEIKTPLSTIQIASSSLKRHVVENSPEQRRIDNISASTEEINQIFNKCLQVIDVENKTIAIDPIEFSLSMLIEDIQKSVDFSKINLEFATNRKITTDYVILRTIILNLLSNALKYAKADSTINFALHTLTTADDEASKLLFKVTNQIGAVGAPDEKRVFSRYYRSESAKQVTGSGLGLWLSQQMANYINSKISMFIQKDEVSFQLELSLT
jgi:signal transduction histidine kinase